MSTGWVIGIIVLAISLILSNIMLLKKTANQKMPSLKDLEKKANSNNGKSNQESDAGDPDNTQH